MTGIRLQDIWRYSRLQWSIPYQPTPGRNLHYLIRDEAGSNRPIIGVAALGNAILGLNQRYGPSWLRPTAILPALFVKFGVQMEF